MSPGRGTQILLVSESQGLLETLYLFPDTLRLLCDIKIVGEHLYTTAARVTNGHAGWQRLAWVMGTSLTVIPGFLARISLLGWPNPFMLSLAPHTTDTCPKHIHSLNFATSVVDLKPAWKAWGCESCLTSLPYLTEPYWVLLGPSWSFCVLLGLSGSFWVNFYWP